MNSPNFIVIGASKTGTTWLYRSLEKHEDIIVPYVKETNYFSHKYYKDPEWYNRKFSDGKTKAVGEVCPSYIVNPESAKRIREFNENMKILSIFRDPVMRAYSHYCMLLRGGKMNGRPNKEITKDTRVVNEGLYYKHIQRYRSNFPETNIKCMLYSHLRCNPVSFLDDVCSFLGVTKCGRDICIENKVFKGKSIPKYPYLYNSMVKLVNYVKGSSKFGAEIIKFVKQSPLSEVFHQVNRGRDFPKFSREIKRNLASYYRDDVHRLSKYMDVDLCRVWLDKYR